MHYTNNNVLELTRTLHVVTVENSLNTTCCFVFPLSVLDPLISGQNNNIIMLVYICMSISVCRDDIKCSYILRLCTPVA